MVIDLDARPERAATAVRARRPARPVLLTPAVVLPALLGRAASPPRGSGFTKVLSLDATGSQASLVTADARDVVRVGRTPTVEAYPLRPGGPRWTTPSTGGERLTLHGDSLAVDFSYTGEMTVLDAGTGRLRWRGAETEFQPIAVGAQSADGRVLGDVPGVPPRSCLAAAGFLSCLLSDLTIAVWRV